MDIWQRNQVIVVGKNNYRHDYLRKSLELGQRYQFMCQYMSQEDFIEHYIHGRSVDYSHSDQRIARHAGLSFLASLHGGWPPSSVIPIHKVNWQILPPGEYHFDQILTYYRNLRLQGERVTVDVSRLEKILSLGPTDIYIGTDQFRRYIVFYFPYQGKAVLECPISGNAIYVIDESWEVLSQYSKDELLRYFSHRVRKIVHRGGWFHRLQLALQSWSTY